jgi:hypothetical protein
VRWLIVAWLAGCWHDAPPPREPIEAPAPPPSPVMTRHIPPPEHSKFDAALEQMRGFVDQMCQCADTACVGQVSNDLTTWAQELSKDPEFHDHMDKPTEEESRQAAEITKQLTDCMTRAVAAGVHAPATP